ncbi:hypothetical protein [Peribacillus sp. NPDC055009]
MKNIFEKLEAIFYKIKDEVYVELDHPESGTVFQPKISPEVLQELRDQLNEMNEVLRSGLIEDILDIIEEGNPIEELSSFDFDDYKQDEFDRDDETWDVEERDRLAQEAATEEEDRRYENARKGVETLVDDLLPTLLG